MCADADVEVTYEDIDIDELDPPKVLGDVLESVAGAVFLDSGLSLESVWSVFCPLFEEKIGELSFILNIERYNHCLVLLLRVLVSCCAISVH